MILTLMILLPAAIGGGIVYFLMGELHDRQQSMDKLLDWQPTQGDWLHSRF